MKLATNCVIKFCHIYIITTKKQFIMKESENCSLIIIYIDCVIAQHTNWCARKRNWFSSKLHSLHQFQVSIWFLDWLRACVVACYKMVHFGFFVLIFLLFSLLYSMHRFICTVKSVSKLTSNISTFLVL